MDLTSDVFNSIFSPLAAFLPSSDSTPELAASSVSTTSTTAATPGHGSNHVGNGIESTQTTATERQTPHFNTQSLPDSLAPLPSSCSSSGTETDIETGTKTDIEIENQYHWQLDTADPTARRYFATPRFALDKPPLRVDVYLPAVEDFPKALKAAVKPDKAFWFSRRHRSGSPRLTRQGQQLGQLGERDDGDMDVDGDGKGDEQHLDLHVGSKIAGLEVGKWLTRVLARWQAGLERDDPGALERKWWTLPFGSGIFVDVAAGAGQEEVCLVPEYGVEQGMLGVETLRQMWAGEVLEERWDSVRVVEWERLRFRRQVHEVISLVGVGGDGDDDGEEADREVVFKSVLQEQRYMYNELKMLLMLEPHPNVMSRPLGVVTKKARFGNRRGVCGFLLEWFPLGSLRERLLQDDYERTTSMEQKLRWARQVTEAFVHVNGLGNGAGFYSDLKPDNLLLREDAETGMMDAVLIDFEQRGGWFAWSPPEVAYLEYLEILVDDPGLPDEDFKEDILHQLRKYYGDPDWSPDTTRRGRYHNTEGGFSSAWLALLKDRKGKGPKRDSLERAQVFMLGKLLWCIFEGQPLVRCGIDHEVLRDPDPEGHSASSGRARAFPEFKRTPHDIRQLIRTCTAGAPEWGGCARPPGVVLRGGKLYPAASGLDPAAVSATDTLKAARKLWCHEVERARSYLRASLLVRGMREEDGQNVPPESPETPDMGPALDLLRQIQARPLFSEVLDELDRIESSLQ